MLRNKNFVHGIAVFLRTNFQMGKISQHILITVQRDATQSSLFIILQVHSSFFLSLWSRAS